MSAQAEDRKRVTTAAFAAFKQAARPIVMVTAYDYALARLADQAGVDALLVGDSLGMTVLGHGSTIPVTLDDVVRATASVNRGAERAMVISDMPFLSNRLGTADTLRNAGRLMAEGGAQAVKIEGADKVVIEAIESLVASGIPVMGHLGLTPQSVNVLGGYRTQARDAAGAAKLLSDAVALQAAGAFAIVLECIPAELATRASSLLDIPTIGIGAGAGCDGQVQVVHDLLGLTPNLPRHAAIYADVAGQIRGALESYAEDVRGQQFPGEANATHADPETLAEAELLFGARLDDEAGQQ